MLSTWNKILLRERIVRGRLRGVSVVHVACAQWMGEEWTLCECLHCVVFAKCMVYFSGTLFEKYQSDVYLLGWMCSFYFAARLGNIVILYISPSEIWNKCCSWIYCNVWQNCLALLNYVCVGIVCDLLNKWINQTLMCVVVYREYLQDKEM